MIRMENSLYIEIWSLFKTYVDSKLAYEVAERYVTLLEDNGLSVSDFEELLGSEKVLDKAINNHLAEHDEDC